MAFVQNFPLFCIVLTLIGGPVSIALGRKKAKTLNLLIFAAVLAMNLCLLVYTAGTGESYVYYMGHFPAPWGNEIRFGVLEVCMAVFLVLIMMLATMAGAVDRLEDIEGSKENLFYCMMNLLLSSILALIYTNDLFTAYVFVEINTIAACGLIIIKKAGRNTASGIRYMVMSLMGSALFLLGVIFTYSITGHLLMANIHESIVSIHASGQYPLPLLMAIGLMLVGLAIKSGLFPFHGWIPDAYGYSTVSSQAVLSSVVSKGYLFLLIKIVVRVIGLDIINDTKAIDILFVLGIISMILGSVYAMKEKDINRMVAYSSVAQIGYIFMGIGMGTMAGIIASVYHIMAHATAKSLLFVTSSGLKEASGGSTKIKNLIGSAYRNRLAGVGFTAGALSMVGIPSLGGFISKLLFAQAAMDTGCFKMIPALIALAVSTILNAAYFLKTCVRIYTPADRENIETDNYSVIKAGDKPSKSAMTICFIVINFALGIGAIPVMMLLGSGLSVFA